VCDQGAIIYCQIDLEEVHLPVLVAEVSYEKLEGL
jgi:hypothetical protein